jgi:hypothetical protein
VGETDRIHNDTAVAVKIANRGTVLRLDIKRLTGRSKGVCCCSASRLRIGWVFETLCSHGSSILTLVSQRGDKLQWFGMWLAIQHFMYAAEFGSRPGASTCRAPKAVTWMNPVYFSVPSQQLDTGLNQAFGLDGTTSTASRSVALTNFQDSPRSPRQRLRTSDRPGSQCMHT